MLRRLILILIAAVFWCSVTAQDPRNLKDVLKDLELWTYISVLDPPDNTYTIWDGNRRYREQSFRIDKNNPNYWTYRLEFLETVELLAFYDFTAIHNYEIKFMLDSITNLSFTEGVIYNFIIVSGTYFDYKTRTRIFAVQKDYSVLETDTTTTQIKSEFKIPISIRDDGIGNTEEIVMDLLNEAISLSKRVEEISTSNPSVAVDTIKVKKDTTSVKAFSFSPLLKKPQLDSETIFRIPQDLKIQILNKYDADYFLVVCNGKRGYLHKLFIRKYVTVP